MFSFPREKEIINCNLEKQRLYIPYKAPLFSFSASCLTYRTLLALWTGEFSPPSSAGKCEGAPHTDTEECIGMTKK